MADGDASHSPHDFAQSYRDLVDHHRHRLAHYLSDDAILDWFGHSVVGRDSVTSFFNDELPYTKHNFDTVQTSRPIQPTAINLSVGKQSDHLPVTNGDTVSEECGRSLTPDSKIPRPWDDECCDDLGGLSQLSLQDGDDSRVYQQHDICNAPIARKKRRWYFDHGQQNKTDVGSVTVSEDSAEYLEAFGTMAFIRQNPSPSSAKSLKRFTEQKCWKERNCKVNIGYTTVENKIQISFIIYHDNMRCRKKLFAVEDDVG